MTDSSSHAWVIASSSLFFIPAIMSFFRQSLLVTIVFLCSALFSTLYHSSNEKSYADMDVLWANLAIFTALVLLALIAVRYPIWNWRVLLPVVFGLIGLVLYFVEGQADPNHPVDVHYDLYHSLWHLFICLAGVVLVWTPVDLSEANASYAEIYIKILKNNADYSLNTHSLLK